MGNVETGKRFSIVIAVYLVVKQVVNLILGAGISSLILPIVMAILLILGIKYCNYGVACVLVIIAISHMGTNLSNFGFNRYLLYIVEGIIDILGAVALCVNNDIKAYFDTPKQQS
ncbi:MAG: hypothetical protein LIO71_05430 [Ruminococcus sp.]|nr:hypothetical protein [Ruminococcus sp.]MCD7799955.1 hypothetical protein [Ruminococcus sp.]